MSADNGIYILITKRILTQRNGVNINPGKEHKVYRVAHTSAIDNFDWYKENQQQNLGAYMKDVWGESLVFTSEGEALVEASKQQKQAGYTEYGINFIDASDMFFYGDM